ncbi:hypothetical protein KKHLCK_03580 [Candidatus Electrothrix laxa]
MEIQIKESAKKIKSLYLGASIAQQLGLETGKKYQIKIQEDIGTDLELLTGTLTASWNLGGLSRLYRRFNLNADDSIDISFDDGLIKLTPPIVKKNTPTSFSGSSNRENDQNSKTNGENAVFDKKKLKHIHIEAYSPGNLGRWTPRTEGDIYMIFGALSEYTDFRYCCGTNQSLLSALEYSPSEEHPAKPDAIIIDRDTNEYLIAELKMKSSAFKSNHHPDDIDVLICWEDDAKNQSSLPKRVLVLREVLESAVKANEIEL